MSKFIFNSPEYKELQKQIDTTLALMDDGIVVSQEGFGSFTKKILLGITDHIVSFINNAMKDTFSLFNIGGIFDKIIITSPISDFYNKNATKATLAFKAHNLKNLYQNVVVNKPRGMDSSYPEVANTNEQILVTLNMIPFIKAVNNDLKIIDSIFDDKVSTVESFTAKLSDCSKATTANFKNLMSLSKTHDKQFSGNEHIEIKTTLSKEFGSTEALNKFCDRMVDIFDLLKKVKDIRNEYGSQSLLIRKVIDKVEKREELLTKENINMLSEYFRYIAACYQLFGSVCLSHIAMENNIIMSLNAIMDIYMRK